MVFLFMTNTSATVCVCVHKHHVSSSNLGENALTSRTQSPRDHVTQVSNTIRHSSSQ